MQKFIPSPFPGPIFYHKETTSTMELARRAVEVGLDGAALDGAVFWAGYQHTGRGRLKGRRWESLLGENLLFTILISKDRSPMPLTAFPLATGLAAALTLEEWGLEPRIKWPNDLLCRGRKVAGILCETQGAWLSAGVGLNLAQGRFPSELAEKAASLGEFLPNPPEAERVLERFLLHFHDVLGREDWRRPVEDRLFKGGETLEVESGLPGEDAPRRSGIVKGLGPRGELILQEPGGETFSVFSGEVI